MAPNPHPSREHDPGPSPDAAGRFQRRGEPEELPAPDELPAGREGEAPAGNAQTPTATPGRPPIPAPKPRCNPDLIFAPAEAPNPTSDPREIGRAEGRGIGEAGGGPGEVGGERPGPPTAAPPPVKPATERQLDQAVAESFPASDPTSTQREPPGAGDAPPDLRHRLPPEGKGSVPPTP